MKKIKVVWICHFSNSEIQNLLPLWKKKKEFAPWIPNILRGFEDNNDFELHIIAPHEYLIKGTKFNLRNIHYYFLPHGIPIWRRHYPDYFNLEAISDSFLFRKRIKKIINQLIPDLIHLQGCENAYYSSSIFDFKDNYPILVTIQGFISEIKYFIKRNIEIKRKISTEEKILRLFSYFAGEMDSSSYIFNYNPNHKFFKHYFPVDEELLKSIKDEPKKYDCIFWGRINKLKGTEDFVRIISELKKFNPKIKAAMLGVGDLCDLKKLAESLDCSDNIDFIGFIDSQIELFRIVKSSKIFLCPTYADRLPSTIREAMILKVPVIAYATGGIPYINKYKENIIIVNQGDYKEMADKTKSLLENEVLKNKLISKAYNYYFDEFSLEINTNRIINAYHQMLKTNIN